MPRYVRDEGLAEFQNENCAKGCRFADETKIGSGRPCCSKVSGLISDGKICYSRATTGKDPIFTCQNCRLEIKYSDLVGSTDEKNNLYEMRVCSISCARQIR